MQIRGTREQVLRALDHLLVAMRSTWGLQRVLASLHYGRHKSVPADVGRIQVHLYRPGHDGEVVDAPDDAVCDLKIYHQLLR